MHEISLGVVLVAAIIGLWEHMPLEAPERFRLPGLFVEELALTVGADPVAELGNGVCDDKLFQSTPVAFVIPYAFARGADRQESRERRDPGQRLLEFGDLRISRQLRLLFHIRIDVFHIRPTL